MVVQNKISKRKIPLTGFVIVKASELCKIEERVENLEREFKKEMTTNEIRSRINGQVLAQIAETSTEKALAMKIQENGKLRTMLSTMRDNHGRNLHIA